MSYFLSDEQQQIRELARKFSRQAVEPLANRIDADERTPPSLVQQVGELGFYGLRIPEAYGGSGADLTTACVVLEEIAKASPAFAGMLSVQMLLCPEAIVHLGTEAQKQRLLPKSATGERLMAWSQTEPAGAGNIAHHQTRLTPDGENWRLNGAKLFCTQGEAKTYVVMCRTRVGEQQGYGAVIVDQESPGFHVAPYEDKLGWRGTNTGSIDFTDVLIRPQDVLGPLLTANQDLFIPVNMTSFIGHAVTSLGCVEGLLDKTLVHVRERTLYDQPMHRLSPFAFQLADVHNKVEAMRCLIYSATRLHDEGRTDHPVIGSTVKAYVCDLAFQCTSTLLQMWGGSGIMNSTGVNRYMRDARTNMVAEGATEMHTTRIARVVLGLA